MDPLDLLHTKGVVLHLKNEHVSALWWTNYGVVTVSKLPQT